MWCGIFGAAPVIAWYVSAGQDVVQSLRASPHSQWPSIFLGLAVLCFIGMLLANAVAHSRWERLFKNKSGKQQEAETTGSAQFKNVDEFYNSYSSRMLNDTEELVRKESSQYPAGTDRERYLTRAAAMLVTILIFEKVWLTIYGSQLRLLNDLNSTGIKTYDQIRAYYEQVALANPENYKAISFEAWISYLKSWVLIRDMDAHHVEITIRGQDFLRYLLECRYDPALRTN